MTPIKDNNGKVKNENRLFKRLTSGQIIFLERVLLFRICKLSFGHAEAVFRQSVFSNAFHALSH